MKIKKTIIIILASILLFAASCKKKGCTDSNAKNYGVVAVKDDGSCSYPTKLKIGDIQYNFSAFGSDMGIPWDDGDEADTYIVIKQDGNILLETDIYYDNTHFYSIVPIIPVLSITDFDNPLTIYLYDKDDASSIVMGTQTIHLNNYTHGSLMDQTYFPQYSQEICVMSTYNHIVFTLSGLSWE